MNLLLTVVRCPIFIAVLLIFIIFSIGEIGSIYWLKHFGNALDITKGILKIDPILVWRQRASLNTTFLDLSLNTSELGLRYHRTLTTKLKSKTVLILGPSSTFGWGGVRNDETYAASLEALSSSNLNLKVINGGKFGYSSEQGVRFTK